MTVEHVVVLVVGMALAGICGMLLGQRRAQALSGPLLQELQTKLSQVPQQRELDRLQQEQQLRQTYDAELRKLEADWHSERTDLVAREQGLSTRLEEYARIEDRLEEERGELYEELRRLQLRLREVELSLTEQRAQKEEAERAATERSKLLEAAREQFRLEFSELSHKLLEEKTEKLGEQSQKLVEGTISPLREQLGDFRKKIEDVYDKEAKERVSLQTQVEQLHKQSQSLSQQALQLTQALKGQSKVRGTWGEQTLESLLESSGLHKGVEYEAQKSLLDADGARKQPDIIVNLPDARHIVIDSKVSLTAYLAYIRAETDEEQQSALRAHLTSLRAHVADLAKKDYASAVGEGSVDFVLLFVPIEPALLVALAEDPELFSQAYQKKVIIVGATTLLATLRTVEGIWRFERQSKNAEEIARQAGDLWDHLARTLESLESLGKHLEGAHESFEETMKRMTVGRGNLRRRAETLRQLGVRGKKELPSGMMKRLEAAEIEEIPSEPVPSEPSMTLPSEPSMTLPSEPSSERAQVAVHVQPLLLDWGKESA